MHTSGVADADGYPVGMLQAVGEFSYDRREDRWTWSEEMYRIHGFEPGEVVPTTALALSHKVRDEGKVGRGEVAEAVEAGKPAAFRNRILDARGRRKTVVAVWKGVPDDSGEIVEVHGYMIDVTRSLSADTSSAVSAAFEHRAVIDQAKGMLMLVHGISAEAAFAVLQDASCRSNTKLYILAERLVARLCGREEHQATDELAEVASQVLANGFR